MLSVMVEIYRSSLRHDAEIRLHTKLGKSHGLYNCAISSLAALLLVVREEP